MKLYYSPGACSLSPHIVVREAQLPVELIAVDLATKRTLAGQDYLQVQPKGYVPLLVLPDGRQLAEGPAIVQYLGDLVPSARLVPPAGTWERYQLQEWLNFITSELHKGYSPLFSPDYPEEGKQLARDKLILRYQYVNAHLQSHPWVLGSLFTVADAYLFTVTNWARFVKLDLSAFSAVQDYLRRMEARPAVRVALQAEGLRGPRV